MPEQRREFPDGENPVVNAESRHMFLSFEAGTVHPVDCSIVETCILESAAVRSKRKLIKGLPPCQHLFYCPTCADAGYNGRYWTIKVREGMFPLAHD